MTEIIKPKLSDLDFKIEFRKRLEELQKWGVGNGYFITAYLDLTPNGAVPNIGFRKLSQQEQEKLNEPKSKIIT